MTAENNKKWTDYIGGQAPAEYRKITVRLPDSLLDSLSVSTTNEDIAVGELAVNESISLKANGGNISFLMLSAGNEIALDVKNGNITGAVSGSYDDYAISCTVKKGRMQPARQQRKRRKKADRCRKQRGRNHTGRLGAKRQFTGAGPGTFPALRPHLRASRGAKGGGRGSGPL